MTISNNDYRTLNEELRRKSCWMPACHARAGGRQALTESSDLSELFHDAVKLLNIEQGIAK